MSQPPADEAAPPAGEAASDYGSGKTAPQNPAVVIDFATLVPRFESALLRYVTQLLGYADHDLEDIVQDAFLRLHRHVHEHGQGSVQNVSTWLFRVAHNLTMDTLRKRKVRRQVRQRLTEEAVREDAKPQRANLSDTSDPVASKTGSIGIAIEDTLGDMERREACQRAMQELESLPENQRQAVMLKMIEGMTIRQIAEVTDTSIGNVGYRISQGLAELSRRLKKAGVI
jgi:RNA polymerase sigma-70 factor (ECF subfamily)